MVQYNFRGFMAPVFTAFNNDATKSVNVDIIPKYSDLLVKSGVHGVLVNGTSGEAMSMTVAERKLCAEKWAEECRRNEQSLMVQVGGAALPDVLDLARHAESIKANAILCLPELYFKPSTTQQLIDYLKLVSQAAPNTPLFYYHVPMFTSVTVNMVELLREGMKQIDTLMGMKFTSPNLEEGTSCLTLEKAPIVFLGADTIQAGAFTLGFDSVIATSLNMLPKPSLNMMVHIRDGNSSMALHCQRKLTEAIDIITKNGSWVSTMKVAMNLMTELNFGEPRAPLDILTEDQQKQMFKELSAAGFIKHSDTVH